ncbi:MAG: undecaprenyldiphospho-muramoylpentapeptide beta-N-acetylglucosaminyltransferase [Candidatus Nitrospinota bacterium M3_3B_026]
MRLIVTGGGTGGHIYPGVAVAREVTRRDGESRVLFVGAKRGMEAALIPREGFDIETLNVTAVKGKGPLGKGAAIALLLAAAGKAGRILSRFGPDAVLGVGGYASAPVLLAAMLRRTPIALAEQNVAPGMANRLFGRFARKAFITWPGSERFFPKGVGMFTGNPVRPEFFSARRTRKDGRMNVLVTGGSQGARSINKAMADAVPMLNEMADLISVTHQTGPADLGMIKDACAAASFSWTAEAFFHDMPQRLADADLVISRAGAGAVAEVLAVGRAAIYVPYPHAADNHQEKNALAMVEAGAAIMVRDEELDGAVAARLVSMFARGRERLDEMGRKARALAAPDAAARIAGELFDMAGKERSA